MAANLQKVEIEKFGKIASALRELVYKNNHKEFLKIIQERLGLDDRKFKILYHDALRDRPKTYQKLEQRMIKLEGESRKTDRPTKQRRIRASDRTV